MAQRREIIAELIEDHEYDAKALLDSLVAALPEDTVLDHLKHIMRVEDWEHRISVNGKIVPKELGGEFETGAFDEDTNDFILTAVNTKSIYDEIISGTTSEDIAASYRREFDCKLHKVDHSMAEAYFEYVTRQN